MDKKQDLKLSQLNQFYGSECYYNLFGFKITEGIKYLMENGYSWFITDSLIAIKVKQLAETEPFLSITLKADLEKRTANIRITDGNTKELYKQRIGFTDSEISEIKLFLTDNVLMLAREY